MANLGDWDVEARKNRVDLCSSHDLILDAGGREQEIDPDLARIQSRGHEPNSRQAVHIDLFKSVAIGMGGVSPHPKR